jgi:hypothetical protein
VSISAGIRLSVSVLRRRGSQDDGRDRRSEAQRILAHALVDQMPERFDALAGQKFPTPQLERPAESAGLFYFIGWKNAEGPMDGRSVLLPYRINASRDRATP